MPKQKTYPTSRAAVHEPPPRGKTEAYAGGAAAGVMAAATMPGPLAPGGAGVRPSEPSAAVLPEAVEAAGVWQNDKRATALWGTNEPRNSWVLIAGVGWKKLATTTDSAALALTVLAAHGKLTQTRVDYREESDGCIHELYVW
jgi:hypothetical protein